METSNNVAAFLLDGKEPGRTAFHWLGGCTTYGELRQVAAQVAGYLLQNGARHGDRVIVVSDNSLFWAAAYLGTLRAGLVAVPLPPAISSGEFAAVVESCSPAFVFAQSAFAARHGAILAGLHLVTDGAAFQDLRKLPFTWDDPAPSSASSDLAALMFTSGSTGAPRGVMVSHANIRSNTESIVEYLSLTPEDRIMAVLPFHYCFGTSLFHTHLRAGASLVVDSRFLYPEKVLERMLETDCTGFAGVPSHFQILLRNSSLKKRRFPSLRYVQQAGGALAPAFINKLSEALPGVKIFIMYGQTEATARLSYLPPEYLTTRCGSIGRGIPGVQLRVLNEAGEDVRPGETGEIVARGDSIACGYWNAPEASAECFRDGGLHTGDLATVDGDGFIYLVDRIKNFVKCGGKRLSCRLIEEHLLVCEDVLQVAVVPMADEVLGEAVKAFVVPRTPSAPDFEERLRLFCRENVPLQLIPKKLVVLNALPMNSQGKVARPALRAL